MNKPGRPTTGAPQPLPAPLKEVIDFVLKTRKPK